MRGLSIATIFDEYGKDAQSGNGDHARQLLRGVERARLMHPVVQKQPCAERPAPLVDDVKPDLHQAQ